MIVSKRNEGNCWRVCVDGKPTAIAVSRGSAPKFREPQRWDVITNDGTYLFEARSAGGAIVVLQDIAQALSVQT